MHKRLICISALAWSLSLYTADEDDPYKQLETIGRECRVLALPSASRLPVRAVVAVALVLNMQINIA